MTRYKHTYSVLCSDIDLKSQMKPLSTPVYFQDCYIRYAAKNYFATFDLEAKNIQWFISDYDICLNENLPYWSENFSVEIWISKISKLKVSLDFIYLYKDTVFAKGRSNWILYDKINKKLLPTNVLFKNTDVMDEPLEEMNKKVDWNNYTEPVRSIEHTVNITDLDFNKHVNNMSYVNIAITTASEEIQNNYYIKRLAVKFFKQAFMNDKLLCTSYSTNYPMEYITNIKTNEDICKIYTVWESKTNKKTILDYDLEVRH